MEANVKRVAIIGIAGFVGQHLAGVFAGKAWQVGGVTSGRNGVLLEHLRVSKATGRYPVVVNLAYPTGTAPLRRHEDNDGIIDQIAGLLQPGGVVIHASTLAVFGLSLERPQMTGKLSSFRDHDYVESKVWMENRLADRLGRNHRVEILRLGNVWGPGSVHWVAGLATRIRSGLPTLLEGDGFSNVTDVANVADYIAWLAERPALSRPSSTPGYHHLGEFSAEPWSRFVGAVAEATGQTPVRALAPSVPGLKSVLVGRVGVEIFKQVNHRPVLGSYARQLLDSLPDSIIKGLRREKTPAATPKVFEEPVLADVLGCRTQFINHVETGWTPPISLSESLARATRWLEWAGFVPEAGLR